jgi:transcriptional regulator with XRE-family HTH domain
MQTVSRPIGGHLREWRQRRHLSQLALACDADISTKHLSFIETGRALPSRDMVLHLAERLEVPLRDRNMLLVAAGYAPVFPERQLQDPALGAARKVVDLVLAGHEPYPALAVDRQRTLIAANNAVALLLEGVEPSLVSPPVNVLRLGLHPAGLAPRIINFVEWRPHLLARLRRQIDLTADPILIALLDEIGSYPTPEDARYRGPPASRDYANAVVPLQLVLDGGALSLFSMTTVFGTPVDITLSELALEAFLPADAATAEALHRLAAAKS